MRLESNIAGSNTTSTSIDGAFGFQSLVAGTYTVVIDAGPDYEPVRDTVTIYGAGGFEGRVSPQTISVPVNLRLKGSRSSRAGTLDASLAKVPGPARELYEKGLESSAKGDSKKAAEQLSSAVALYPDFPQALGELGVQYLKLSQPDKAAESLKKAVVLAPKDFVMRLNYGIALSGKRNYAEAETQLREALKLNNAAPTGHMYLGITLLSLSRDEKTKEFHADKYAEAQKELETAISSGKDEVAQAHRYLGGIYWGNKDYKRAADEFELYLKLSPKAEDAERIRAAVKELRGKQ
ncbi:MAG: tetratricopeptide repeat protein [Pyrinomonadaceae bacterium]